MAQSSRSLVASPLPPEVRSDEGKALLGWITRIHEQFIQRLNVPAEVRYQVLYAAPERPRQGQVVFADGTEWNPGAGEGLYVYKTGGWTLLG